MHNGNVTIQGEWQVEDSAGWICVRLVRVGKVCTVQALTPVLWEGAQVEAPVTQCIVHLFAATASSTAGVYTLECQHGPVPHVCHHAPRPTVDFTPCDQLHSNRLGTFISALCPNDLVPKRMGDVIFGYAGERGCLTLGSVLPLHASHLSAGGRSHTHAHCSQLNQSITVLLYLHLTLQLVITHRSPLCLGCWWCYHV